MNKFILLIFFVALSPFAAKALKIPQPENITLIISDSTIVNDTMVLNCNTVSGDIVNVEIKGDPEHPRRTRIASALLAFPFPFGFIGAHRVMLGCKPWIPIVYVATLGGCFGLLPMIDFFVIVFSKDLEQYENNPHIFMWVK